MNSAQSDVYAASIRRMTRSMVVIAAAGLIASAVVWCLPGAAGFLIGAALSYLGFLRWHRVVKGLGGGGAPSPKAWLLALAPLAVALVLYGILKVSGINLIPVLAGLFVALAAALFEALYQLYAGT